MTIEGRLEKLEDHARGMKVPQHSKAERDAKFAVFVEAVRPVAATCQTWQKFALYLRTLSEDNSDKVISLLDARQKDAAGNAVARKIFERVCSPQIGVRS